MLLNLALIALTAILSVGLAVVGVASTSKHKAVRAFCYIGGPMLVILLLVQGWLGFQSQEESDRAFMASKSELKSERQQTNIKIDGLFALLQTKNNASQESEPRTGSSTPASKAVHPKPPPAQGADSLAILPPSSGLTITQTEDISTRTDAPFKTRVIVQATQTFQSLKLAIRCNKPLVAGATDMEEVLFVTNQGIAATAPNVYTFSYQSAMPPFSPSNPVVVNLWSKEKILCDQAATS